VVTLCPRREEAWAAEEQKKGAKWAWGRMTELLGALYRAGRERGGREAKGEMAAGDKCFFMATVSKPK
jgi:hypothetical protein